MIDEAITLRQLLLRRAHHFEPPGIEIDDLSGGINVIFGPNASGKTTVASAIRTLLWPERPALERGHLIGFFGDKKGQWRVEFDDGRVSRQLDGREVAEGPRLPASEGSDRYYLCLRDLLETDGASFAEIILRESAGGYDVSSARQTLEYTSSTPRRRKKTSEVEGAKKRWLEALDEQEKLRNHEPEIERLQRERDEAREAAVRSEALRRALAYREASEELRQVQVQLDEFPDEMARVRGDEDEELTKYREELRRAAEEETAAQRVVDECEEVLEESPIPAGGLSAELLPTLKEYGSRLKELERSIESKRARLAKAEAIEEGARRYIADTVNEESNIEDVDADAVRELERIARQLDDLEGDFRAFQVMESLLEDGDSKEDGDVDVLRPAIEGLRSWLRCATPVEESARQRDGDLGTAKGLSLACAVVIGGVAVGLSIAVHLAWLVLLVVSVAVGWIFWRLRGSSSDVKGAQGQAISEQESRRQVYRRDFERLDIKGPDKWSEEAVEERLVELVDQWIEERLGREKRRRLKSWRADHQSAVSRRNEWEKERRKWMQKLNLRESEEASSAFWMVSKILEWQQARIAREGVEAQLQDLVGEHRNIMGQTNELLSDVGYGGSSSVSEITGQIEAVEQQARRFESNRDRLQRGRSDVESAKTRRQHAETEIDELFERLGIAECDDDKVTDWCDKKGDYEAVRDVTRRAKQTAKMRKSDLEAHRAFESELLEMSREALQRELEELEKAAEAHDEIVEQLKSLEAEVKAAKKSADVEQRRADYEAVREELRRERELDARRAIGAVLVDHLQERTRDRSRPAVFHRARELFTRFTRGRYRLELSDEDASPEFYARDVTKQVGLSLNELSAGTRLQLFLAVRVAFVEVREDGLQAPLVLDETLANSDDVRAANIIEAVRQIGERGRQIFYFTAQRDEVEKWRFHLENSSVDWREVDLARLVDGAGPGETYGVEVGPPSMSGVLAPGERSHKEYGEALGVGGGLDPWRPVEDVHLWYLVEDPECLYGLLKSGVERWGQLRELAERGGLGAVGVSDRDYDQIRAGAKVLDELAKARAVGRGKPVNRRVLEASGAVSETFIERVSEVCDAVGGDAGRLLEAIDEGEVSRFRTDKAEELRQYLLAEGYLDREKVYSRREIWIYVLAAASDALEREVIDRSDLRALIERATGRRWDAHESTNATTESSVL